MSLIGTSTSTTQSDHLDGYTHVFHVGEVLGDNVANNMFDPREI